jgi:hypothetical protein
MIIINEISLRNQIDEPSLMEFLVTVLVLRTDLIGGEMAFWERLHTTSELSIGMSVRWTASGFQTLLRWYQATDLSHIELLKIAAKASSHFMTDTAIGNFVDSPETSTDRYFMVTADGRFFRAYAMSNSDILDLRTEGPSIAFSEALRQLTIELKEQRGCSWDADLALGKE